MLFPFLTSAIPSQCVCATTASSFKLTHLQCRPRYSTGEGVGGVGGRGQKTQTSDAAAATFFGYFVSSPPTHLKWDISPVIMRPCACCAMGKDVLAGFFSSPLFVGQTSMNDQNIYLYAHWPPSYGDGNKMVFVMSKAATVLYLETWEQVCWKEVFSFVEKFYGGFSLLLVNSLNRRNWTWILPSKSGLAVSCFNEPRDADPSLLCRTLLRQTISRGCVAYFLTQ